jgi:hypothetical protein
MTLSGFDLGQNGAWLVHVAALCQLSGFLLRDQLRLRALVMLGNALYVTYYFLLPVPLWDAMFWSAAIGTTNLVMIAVIARRRSGHAITDDALRVFATFRGMEPGDFRALMALGKIVAADAPTVLTTIGVKNDRLFYVIEGAIEIRRADRLVETRGPMFIGELGYLLDRPASATVTLAPGGRYAVWESTALRRLAARRERIALCLDRVFNRDLALKLH